MEDARENICISFFSFPKDRNEINQWCNLIKRRNGTDHLYIKVTDHTVVCKRHFLPQFIYRAPGSQRKKDYQVVSQFFILGIISV